MAALEAQARRVDIARGEREPEIALEASYGGRWGIGGSGEPSTSGSQSVGTDAAGNITWTRTSPLSGGDSLTSTWGSQGLVSQRYTQSGVEAADNFEDVGRVGVAVDVPIFEGGRIRAQIAKERSRLNAAQQRLRKLELQIRLEVETAVLNANSARERISVTRKSIAEAEESLRIERQKYDFGKGAIVDVLDAQGALLNAQTNYFRALADYSIAKAQVQLAAGNQTP
jgi:outer membrane protein TolC